MAYLSIGLVFLSFLCVLKICVGQYAVPTIKFEAFTPKGLRISIPAEKGVELFAFHGKLNKAILQIEPGEFSEDVTRPIDGRFTYINPSIKLKVGDVINYWVFVQHEQLGFRKDDQSWTVKELVPVDGDPTIKTCSNTITKVLGKSDICSGGDVINYKFTESLIDPQLWQIEQFIPRDPDWEYVIYKNELDVIGVENNVLRIQPKVVEENAMKDIIIDGCFKGNIQPGSIYGGEQKCTRPSKPLECSAPFQILYQPPIVSGRIVSKDAFCFANISIKAKLPQGDWIFPEIYLEDINDPKRRILLAYARGNKQLVGNDNIDIGGTMLFGGPYKNPEEPERSTHLSSHKSQAHLGDNWHVYTVKWTKGKIDLYIDETHYGIVNSDALLATGFNKEKMVRLVLGVGAGGLNDFPDGYSSGTEVKPWKSQGRNAIRDFFNKRAVWQKTWSGNNQLLVEYVTIKAL